MENHHFLLRVIGGLIVAIISFTIPAYSAAATWQASGNYDISWYNTSDNEYTISTAKGLAGLAYIVNNGYADFHNKTIKLGADIDLSAHEWLSIGIGISTYFKGTFNGNNHTISGISISQNSGSYPYYGLFSYLNGNTIFDLNIFGSISLYFSDQAYPNTDCGSLSGYANKCHFKNINSGVNISYTRVKTSSGIGYNIKIGGLVGNSHQSTLEYCVNSGNIIVNFGRTGTNSEYYSNESSSYTGGIIGYASSSTIIGCGNINNRLETYFAGSCNTTYGYVSIGGILGTGASSGTIIKSCYNNAQKFMAEYYGNSYDNRIAIGGIAASSIYYENLDMGYISNNYSSTTSYNTNTSNFYYGGIVGYPSNYNNSSSKYTANYSPNNISTNKNGKSGFNGSTSFAQNQMSGNDFLNELNIYTILNGTTYKWYKDIVGFPYVKDADNAGINSVEVDEYTPDFLINDNNIIFNNDVKVSLFNLKGNCVYFGTTSSIHNIPTGIYIIRYCNIAKKIYVK